VCPWFRVDAASGHAARASDRGDSRGGRRSATRPPARRSASFDGATAPRSRRRVLSGSPGHRNATDTGPTTPPRLARWALDPDGVGDAAGLVVLTASGCPSAHGRGHRPGGLPDHGTLPAGPRPPCCRRYVAYGVRSRARLRRPGSWRRPPTSTAEFPGLHHPRTSWGENLVGNRPVLTPHRPLDDHTHRAVGRDNQEDRACTLRGPSTPCSPTTDHRVSVADLALLRTCLIL